MMTNYRQYHWRIVKVNRKQSTCKLAAESLAVEEEKSNLLPPSHVKTEQRGVGGCCWGGGGVGGSILLSSPACQLCRQLGAFVTTSASCQASDWPVGGKLRPKPQMTQLPMSASDRRAGKLAKFLIQSARGGWGEECIGCGGPARVGRVISEAASSMSAKTVSPARMCCHMNTSKEMDRRGWRGRAAASYPSK